MFGKVRIEQAWTRDAVKVWFYTPLANGTTRVHRLVGHDQWEDVLVEANGLLPDPSLVLPASALGALVAEAGDILPPSAATDRHLKDTIDVRDRLLSLVEKGG